VAGLKDLEVLALAARDDRTLVTHDQSTMPRHFSELCSHSVTLASLLFRSIFRFDRSRRPDSDLGGD
jgi:hypothetical protein